MSSMNRNIYKYLYAVLLLSLVLLPTGCADDGDGLYPEPGNGTTSYVTFRVVTPKVMAAGTATRAVPDIDDAGKWGDGYFSEAGVDFDNALIGNQFNVFITSSDGTLITTLRDLLYIETTDSGNNVVYSFSGEIPKDKVEDLKTYSNAKIHIVANCGSDISLSDALVFSHVGQPSETFTAIPMWGVETFNFTTLKPGYNDAGEIWLLRAMAKVEIIIAAPPTGKENFINALTSASVTNANTQGYVLPQGWSTVADTKALSFENSLRALSSVVVDGISSMTPADDNTTDKIVFYLPETANTGGTTEITLNYTTELTGSESRSDVIKFAKYENGTATGTHYDIVRNHLYRFEVSLSGAQEEIDIHYTVCPLDNCTIEIPEFE